MADVDLEWNDDANIGPDGDLVLVEGSDMVRQHIERHLFTSGHGYLWHPEYGAGLPERIGRVAKPANIAAIVRARILSEPTVARIPVPVVTVDKDETILGLFNIEIQYQDAVTGDPQQISLEIPTRGR